MNIKDNINDGINGYIATEDEIKESYGYMSDEMLNNNLGQLIEKKTNELSNSDNKEDVKKGISDKLMDFVDSATKFGFTNYAIFFLVFTATNDCSSGISALYNDIHEMKNGLANLKEICEDTANQILNFDNAKIQNQEVLKQYENDAIKYNYEADKLERLYKEEEVKIDDVRLTKMRNRIDELATNLSKGNNEKVEKIKKMLMKEADSLITTKLIKKGYDICKENMMYTLNGKEREVSKDTFIVMETKETYNTRIKQLEDKGILKDNSLEEEELTRTQC